MGCGCLSSAWGGYNHLGPQINGLLLRAASKSSGRVFVMNIIQKGQSFICSFIHSSKTNRQTNTMFTYIYKIQEPPQCIFVMETLYFSLHMQFLKF
jgi:hypothetical protein